MILCQHVRLRCTGSVGALRSFSFGSACCLVPTHGAVFLIILFYVFLLCFLNGDTLLRACSVFKLREAKPSAVVQEMRASLIDSLT